MQRRLRDRHSTESIQHNLELKIEQQQQYFEISKWPLCFYLKYLSFLLLNVRFSVGIRKGGTGCFSEDGSGLGVACSIGVSPLESFWGGISV